jgi:hypothetical protein
LCWPVLIVTVAALITRTVAPWLTIAVISWRVNLRLATSLRLPTPLCGTLIGLTGPTVIGIGNPFPFSLFIATGRPTALRTIELCKINCSFYR